MQKPSSAGWCQGSEAMLRRGRDRQPPPGVCEAVPRGAEVGRGSGQPCPIPAAPQGAEGGGWWEHDLFQRSSMQESAHEASPGSGGVACTKPQMGSTIRPQLGPPLAPDSLWWGRGGRKRNPEAAGVKQGWRTDGLLCHRAPPPIYFFGKQEAGFSFHPKSLQNVAGFRAAFIYLFLPFVGNRRVCS